MRRRFKSTLLIIAFLFIAALCMGGFYFLYDNINKKDAFIKVSGPLSVNFLSGNHVDIKGSGETEISIINDSNEDAYYFIEFKNLENIGDVKYTITGSKDFKTEGKLNPYNTIVSSYILIEAGQTEKYKIAFAGAEDSEYSLDIDINMENLQSNTFADTILKNNEIKKEPLTEVGKAIATENEGLITSTDEQGTTYYFRGNVQNNYVNINDYLFRIVRINGDGSVKLVYNNTLDQVNKYYESDYTFGNTDLAKTLDSWAIMYLNDYKDILANQKYCNDYVISDNSFIAYKRIVTDNIPTFYCLGEEVSTKVGLLTADEVVYAGATVNDANQNYYLYTEGMKESYLMTSAIYSQISYSPFTLAADGSISYKDGSTALGVRPVITINKTAVVKSGDGTVNNPYILEKKS